MLRQDDQVCDKCYGGGVCSNTNLHANDGHLFATIMGLNDEPSIERKGWLPWKSFVNFTLESTLVSEFADVKIYVVYQIPNNKVHYYVSDCSVKYEYSTLLKNKYSTEIYMIWHR